MEFPEDEYHFCPCCDSRVYSDDYKYKDSFYCSKRCYNEVKDWND